MNQPAPTKKGTEPCTSSFDGSQPSPQQSAHTARQPTLPLTSDSLSVTIAAKAGHTRLLLCRGLYSLARMYVSDLDRKLDFGRMVDGRGSSVANAAMWRGYIAKIADEIADTLPAESQKLKAYLEPKP